MEDRNILKNTKMKAFLKVFSNLALALASGLMFEYAFVPNKLFIFIFFAFIPLLFAIEKEKPLPAFLYGWLTGFIFFIFHYYWLTTIWGMKFVLILVLYIAVYYGVFTFIVRLLKVNEDLNLKKVFIICTIWIIGEWLRGHILGGYSTGSLAHALFEKPILIQIADLGGFYLVSFFILWINLIIYSILSNTVSIENRKKILVFSLIIFSVLSIYSVIQFRKWNFNKNSNGAQLLIIQPAVDQHKKWDPVYRSEVFSLIEEAFPVYDCKPDLVIFPETVCPTEFRYEHKSQIKMIEYSKRFKGAYILFGSEDFTPDPFMMKDYRLKFNLAFLMKNGVVLGKYDKILPALFAEYNPLRNVIPYLNKYVLGEPIEPGLEFNLLNAGDLKIGTLICLESIYPRLTRDHVKNGANIIINISNEAWFGYYPTSEDIFAASIFRAVEFRRYFIKVSNTGISAAVSPSGKIEFKLPLFHRGNKLYTIYPFETKTPYSRYGEWYFVILIILIFIIRGQPLQGCKSAGNYPFVGMDCIIKKIKKRGNKQ
ncbi:MAG: apolipoprotein N-acyltransferase [bacterium]|nr:apolipoprotein N-acyltransferase [bacterium]